MPETADKPDGQAAYVDLASRLLLDSIARAADEHRHGYDQITITYHAGEIRLIEFVPATTYKI